MHENDVIKNKRELIKKVGRDIDVTNKVLAENQLIPYRKKDKWGFCSHNKVVVINCIYKDANPFKDGLARIKNASGYFGFISHIGDEIVPGIYYSASDFSNGIAQVSINNLRGYQPLKKLQMK